MSVIGSNILAGASGQGGGYNLTRSLRFRSSASASLTKTFSTDGTNNKIQTISVWLKRGQLGTNQVIMGGYDAVEANQSRLQFTTSDTLNLRLGGSVANDNITTAVYRDPSAWYHIVASIDTTQATLANRAKIYVNGVLQTIASPSCTQNQITQFANASSGNAIGEVGSLGSTWFDGYMTEFNFIDGQALTPSSFGETSTTTGVWQPKAYSGTYGTNGFYLPFTDNSALTTSSNVGLGKDFSGNGNYWTTNNISITSGSTYDSMTDVPTLTSATAANYCVMNPLNVDSTTLSNANLTGAVTGSSGGSGYFGTMALPASSKIYAEVFVTSTGDATSFGVTSDTSSIVNARNNCLAYIYSGNKTVLGTDTGYGASYTTNDVIGIAVDTSAGTIEFFKNNTSQGVLTNSVISSNTMFFTCVYYSSTSSANHSWNFGQRPFAYTPPTGFVALNTFNLPTPTIGATASTQANKYFDVSLYTGNGSTNVITNSGAMQPDMVWLKPRSITDSHNLYDSVRGISGTGSPLLSSDLTSAEVTYTGFGVSSLNSNGFTLIGNGGLSNSNSQSYVGWQWRASNAAGVTNTAGSITSTVSANTSSGFSVVTYTGTGASATVGHGLGVAPKMIIVKDRSNTNPWPIYHVDLGVQKYIFLNATDAAYSNLANYWSATAPSSTVFGLNSYGGNNTSGDNYVAYCFSEVAGYSKFGSYTGNGSSDGTFVYLGFRPRYIMVKNYLNAQEWIVIDSARNTYNVAGDYLRPNSSGAENSGSSPSTSSYVDFLSNGIKFRNDASSSGYTNQSGQTYIYAAFAESPFKYANAR